MTILFLRATRYRCQEYAKEQLLSSFSRKSGVGYLSSLELALEAKVSNSDIPCVYSLHKVRPLWCIFFVAKRGLNGPMDSPWTHHCPIAQELDHF